MPAGFPTVRAAVSAAASGDTILVAPGTHDGGAFVNGKVLTIGSRYLVTADTTFVAQTVLRNVVSGVCGGAPGCNGNAILEFGSNAHGSRVIGLTLSNGENGVAAACAVDVVHCRVLGCGDGVDYIDGAGGTIRNSLFANCGDDGIDLNGYMDIAIRDNVIRDNRDDGIEYRLYAYTGPTKQVDIVGNLIRGNGEDGIQLIDYPAVSNIVVRIERNLLTGNFDASGQSAGVGCMPGGETVESLVGAPMVERVYLLNNTFVNEKNGMVGGANVIALNNIFKGTLGSALRRVGGNSIASYNLFWGNLVDHEQSVVDLSHTLSVDPQLDPDGALTSSSPAINAGTALFQWQGATVQNLPPGAYFGTAPDLGAFEYTANLAPTVTAGPDHTQFMAADLVELGPGTPSGMRADVFLGGAVWDDGPPSLLTTTWSVVGGPGPVTFRPPHAAGTRATFVTAGTYTLRLSTFDGALGADDEVVVTIMPPANAPPIVDAGPNRSIELDSVSPGSEDLRAELLLDGLVLDDGQPSPPVLTTQWVVESGPDTVLIESPTAEDTRATFFMVGAYTLRLTASDGEVSTADTVRVMVLPQPNNPPAVNAGPDQTLSLPWSATLDGSVSDDGRPSPPALTTLWSLASGPGPVTFANPNAQHTQASFTIAGTYLLRLGASDGEFAVADTVQVTVLPLPPPVVRSIADDGDDAEERPSGSLSKNTFDLDVTEDAGSQTIGLRFTNVLVPPGMIVTRAVIQFEADEAQSGATSLTFFGHDTDNPTTFENIPYGISGRPRTSASVGWSPPAWNVVGEAGPGQRTPDLKNVVQEIVDRPGWSAGNAMVFIITGTGLRTARSREGLPSGAARLTIEYVPPPPTPSGEGGVRSDVPEPPAAPNTTGATAIPTVAPASRFALHGARPHPARGTLNLEFTLAGDGPARLELVDITGRRVVTRELGSLGAGRHGVAVREALPAGVYLVRLTEGHRVATRKAVVAP